MRLKDSFFYTLRENVKDEDSTSGNLLVRGGFIKKSSSGMYMILPLGKKVMDNIENIIKEEMDAINCQELSMPCLISEDVFISSGRRSGFGQSMFSLKDRFSKPYVLGPTHEELFAIAADMKINSYKDLPFSLYQIQTKFRDEPRPRYGLIRVREFLMKDSYTFDKDEEGLNISYEKQFNAYKRIMDRLNIEYKIVKADTGVMGGLLSEEFQAVTDIGEDVLVLCNNCDFASNIEVANCKNEKITNSDSEKQIELVYTPNAKTIEEVSSYMNLSSDNFVKTLIYLIDGTPYAIMVKGSREVNEVKLRKLFNAANVELASSDVVVEVTSAPIGFAGPINIKCPVIMDEEVSYMKNFIVGANKKDYHYKNVNHKDFEVENISDIRNIQEDDLCPCCNNGRIIFKKGIEVGNTFKLGTKYSKAMNLEYLDSNNNSNLVWMGSYGIGVGRCMAALVEQNNDENGIIWPKNIAPYKVSVITISNKDEKQVELSNEIYEKLKTMKIDTLLDDRDERPGVKFKDIELIGIPLRVVVGKKASENIVEIRSRDNSISQEIKIDELYSFIENFIEN